MTAVFICQHCTGHLFGHAPGCPVSKAMIEWRVAALAARPVPDSGPADEGYWDNGGRHHPALATPEPDLTEAWAQAEAAWPEGWIVSDIVLRSVPGPRAWRAIAQFVTPTGLWPEARRTVGVGPTPIAALDALTAALRSKETP